MKDLKDMVEPMIFEYRTKKNAEPEMQTDIVTVNGKKIKGKDLDSLEGKAAEKNWTGGVCAIDEPTENDAAVEIDPKTMLRCKKQLLMKIKTREDFFIRGEAGWAKTEIIKSYAKKFGLTIVTVYLDKAVATDLGGIPIPDKSSGGMAYQNLAAPAWAAYMFEHPEKEFLLFFDEMNQADPGVQNALMPIVLNHEICGHKFDNFFVGAAGNFESENASISDYMSKPLEQRFAPIITWESRTNDAWADTFKYLHTKWDGVIGEEFVSEFEKNAGIFMSPRIIEHKVFKFIDNLMKSGGDPDGDYDAEDFKLRLKSLLGDIESTEKRSADNTISLLAEFMDTYIHEGGSKKQETVGRSGKNRMMIDDSDIKFLAAAINSGSVFDPQEQKYYGITEENVDDVMADNFDNAEMYQEAKKIALNQKIGGKKVTFKYKTNKEALKDNPKLYFE